MKNGAEVDFEEKICGLLMVLVVGLVGVDLALSVAFEVALRQKSDHKRVPSCCINKSMFVSGQKVERISRQ